VNKTCKRCNQPKDEDAEFYFRKRENARDAICKECRRSESKKWKQDNPARYRQQQKDWKESNPTRAKEWRDSTHYWLKHKYNVTKEVWDAVFEKQGRCCAICKATTPTGSKNGRWHTDHNHVTGELRGILCGNCNVGLGNFQDDPALTRLATAYLEHPPWQSSLITMPTTAAPERLAAYTTSTTQRCKDAAPHCTSRRPRTFRITNKRRATCSAESKSSQCL
jgi:hypothetical protein